MQALIPRDSYSRCQAAAKSGLIMRMNSRCKEAAKACAPIAVHCVPIPTVQDYWNICVATSAHCKLQKKEEPMIDMEQNQRNYLERRIIDVQEDKDIELNRVFGLSDDESPKTAEEFVQRIQDGAFTLRDKMNSWGHTFHDRVRWRKPDVVEDRAGYEAAEKRLDAAKDTLVDQARLYSIAEATKAFEAFKSANFATA